MESNEKYVWELKRQTGVVDKHDQLLACFPNMRKFLKSYNKILCHMTDAVLPSTN